jgi:hypothetical protein
MPTSAPDEYRARAEARRATAAALAQQEIRLSQLRLVTFAGGALLAFLTYRGTVNGWWLLVPLAAFIALALRHDRTIRARTNAERAESFYLRGLSRIESRWQGTGEPGERFRDDAHLYANDLDLFGPGSLFELLSLARTQAGEETLAAWLKAPAPRDVVLARQEAVRELTPSLDLREALSLVGGEVRKGVRPEVLIAWAEAPPQLGPSWQRQAAVAQTIVTLAALGWTVWSGEYIPLLLALMVQGVTRARAHARIDAVLHRADSAARELVVLGHLLEQLERQRFTAPRLAELHALIEGRDHHASAIIQRLQRLVEAHDWEHNIVFAPIGALLSWSTHIAWGIESWRARHGTEISRWLRAVGELEALSSLSAYRYEHPEDVFPEILIDESSTPRAVFEGLDLGHPLLPSAKMIRNDVRLGDGHGLIVISGSNMSGKSTLLRTVGVNVVLALAGAPVRASSLRLCPLAIGTTLRIQDSLQEGRSRFYAEITRMRAIVDMARGPRPVLFLLDELFHGTNSHDRLIGASGVLHNLLALGAIGMITTHDLALTAVVDDLGSRAVNAHFEDTFEAGEIRFDYRLKPGPVRRSNALALMRAVGLEVEPRAIEDS